MIEKSELANRFYFDYTEEYVSRWALISMVGFALFALALVIMYMASEDFALTGNFLMDFAISGQSRLLIVAAVSAFVAFYSLTKTIYLAYPFPLMSCCSIFFLGVVTLSVIMWFFPADQAGLLHGPGFFAGAVSLLVFMLKFTMKLKISGLIRGFYNIILLPAVLAPVLFIINISMSTGAQGAGFIHLVNIALISVWLLITANGIRVRAITYV